MILLCIESSSDPTVLGVADDNKLLKEALLEDRDRISDATAQLLAECGKSINDVGAIALGIGPGSFTGLRVGLAYAKGLARALAIPLWPVSSLKVIAANVTGPYDSVVALTPARKGQAHMQRFTCGGLRDETEAAVIEYERLREQARAGVVFAGPAIYKLEEKLQAELKEYIPNDSMIHRAQAGNLARLALEQWQHNTPPAAGSLVPVYGLDFGR